MFWLRWLFFSSPFWLGLGGIWLFRAVADFQLERESDALVHAIDGPVGYLSPLAPADGVTGEIADLVFEPLLRRDAGLQLKPNLLERWTSRTVVTIRCESEEAAGEAEARIRAGEIPKTGPRPVALERVGSVLVAAYEGAGESPEKALLDDLPPELLGDYELIRIEADHSVDELVEAWLKGSLERSQVRMIDYRGERLAHLFVKGAVERVADDLRRYLASNPSVEADLELAGHRCHTVSRELVLEFRTGVKWHDGHEFTAEDVAFSFRFLTGPDSPLPLAQRFDFVDSVEALDSRRLRVACREIPATMPESWESLPVLPAHLLARAPDPLKALDTLSDSPVGLGPYRFERRRDDGGAVLAAWSGYHRGCPREPKIRYRRFPSLESVLFSLRRGELQAIEPDQRFLEWSRRNPGTVETVRDRARFQHLVMWNLDREPLNDLKVREALARAVDPAAVLRDGATTFETPATSLYSPGVPFVAEPMLLPLHDPRGAARLLEESGKAIRLSLLVNAGHAEHRRLAEALAEQWRSVGAEVAVEPVEWADLVSRRLPERDFDAVLVSWELPMGRDLGQIWHSSEAGPGGGNLSGLKDEEVDRLLERLRHEADPAEVHGAVAALQRALMKQHPCLFVCDTGRILTLRQGGLEMHRPDDAGDGVEPLAVGKDGIRGSRPWWVRRNPEQP